MEDSKELAMVLANCSEAGLQAFNTWMIYKYVDLIAGVIMVICFFGMICYGFNKMMGSMR